MSVSSSTAADIFKVCGTQCARNHQESLHMKNDMLMEISSSQGDCSPYFLLPSACLTDVFPDFGVFVMYYSHQENTGPNFCSLHPVHSISPLKLSIRHQCDHTIAFRQQLKVHCDLGQFSVRTQNWLRIDSYYGSKNRIHPIVLTTLTANHI